MVTSFWRWGNDRQFQRFCDVIGRDDLASDARFTTNQDRVANRAALTPEIEASLSNWAMADILAALEAATVPAGPINTMEQTFENPQIRHRGMQIDPQGIPGVRGPWVFSDAVLKLDRSAPVLPERKPDNP